MGQSTRVEPDHNRDDKSETDATGTVRIAADRYAAVIFDMDGVVTKTAIIHTSAWKEVFDQFLKMQSSANFKPFSEGDYLNYVDGKAREDGIKDFLASRQIHLPLGKSDDKPGFDTICALGNLKNGKFREMLSSRGVECYETTVGLIRTLKKGGFKVGIVTASKNGAQILEAANLSHVFDAKVDGVDAESLGLPGKPNPDTFLEAALRLGVTPSTSVVVEDAAAGVEAGHRGNFGLVIGVARTGNDALLKEHGADVVVGDLGDVTVSGQRNYSSPGMALSDMAISDKNWVLTFDKYVPKAEAQREALCALGNGYFCTRAAAPESNADDVHYPGTYLAGAYDRATFHTEDQDFEQEQIVNMPNWLSLTFKRSGQNWFNLKDVEILSYKQKLDMRAGLLHRDITFVDAGGKKTTIAQRWFVHMQQSHLAALETTITAHDWSGKITIRSALDGLVINKGTRWAGGARQHLRPVDSAVDDEVISLKMKTIQSGISVAQAARTTIFEDGKPKPVTRDTLREPGYIGQDIDCVVRQGTPITVQKIASLYSSRDRAISEPWQAAREALEEPIDFYHLLSSQISAWRSLWRQFDLFIETTEEHSKMLPSLLLHFNCFHALQTASPNTIDLDVGLPARGWTGEGYEGHIFWDDLFMFPFINLRAPNITETYLKYRYRRLQAAREIAKSLGASGARFPWQSASDGREETQLYLWLPDKNTWIPDRSHLQAHVNAAIAYNVWQYYQVTANFDFMHSYGAEILFEVARFFASFAKYNRQRDRYEIHHVVGPDEYHTAYPDSDRPGINNNAYTNIMAVWCLCRALEFLDLMPTDHTHEIRERLAITDDEISLWERVSRRMYVPVQDSGIISQFEGYESLKEFPLKKGEKLDAESLNRVLNENNGSLNEFKISKQADVLMLFYVFSSDELREIFERLGYPFQYATIPKNIDYYMPRTSNLSTLSRVAHAWVLSRGDRRCSWNIWSKKQEPKFWPATADEPVLPHSWDIFIEALGSDFSDVGHGTTGEGVHLGAMAGAIDIVQRCYTGLVTRGDVLWLHPCLPSALTRLSFSLHYRDQALTFEISQSKLTVTAQHSSAHSIKIGFGDTTYELKAGETKEFHLKPRNTRNEDWRKEAA